MNSKNRKEVLSHWVYDYIGQHGPQRFDQLYGAFSQHLIQAFGLNEEDVIRERQFRIDLNELIQNPEAGTRLIYARRRYSILQSSASIVDLQLEVDSVQAGLLLSLLKSMNRIPLAQELAEALVQSLDAPLEESVEWDAEFLQHWQAQQELWIQLYAAIQAGQVWLHPQESSSDPNGPWALFAPYKISLHDHFLTRVRGFEFQCKPRQADAQGQVHLISFESGLKAVTWSLSEAETAMQALQQGQFPKIVLSASARKKLALYAAMPAVQSNAGLNHQHVQRIQAALAIQARITQPGDPTDWLKLHAHFDQFREDYLDLFRGKNTRATRWLADPNQDHPFESWLETGRPTAPIRYVLVSEAPPSTERSSYIYHPDHHDRTHWLNAPLGAFDYPVNPKDRAQKTAALLHLAKQGVLLLELFPLPIYQHTDRQALIKPEVVANYWDNNENPLSVSSRLEKLAHLLHERWDLCLIASEQTTDLLLKNPRFRPIHLMNGPRGMHPDTFRRKEQSEFTQKAVLSGWTDDPIKGHGSRPSFPTAELIKKAFDFPMVQWTDTRHHVVRSSNRVRSYPRGIVPPKHINLLIIAENIPNMSKAWCRLMLHEFEPVGANNMLHNICKCLNIRAASEKDLLRNLLDHGVFIINTYPPHEAWHPRMPPLPIENILQDVAELKPKRIMVTSIRSNQFIVSPLLKKGYQLIPVADSQRANSPRDWVFPSPSNRAYQRFKEAIMRHRALLEELLR